MTDMRSRAEHILELGAHRDCDDDTFARLHGSGLVGTVWQHYRNGHDYTITGFSWNGDLDEWCIEYQREGMFTRFNRTMTNAFGYIDGVHHRFTEVIAA